MDKCRWMQMVNDYYDNRLKPKDKEEFEEHLKGCSACAGELAQLRRISEQLQKWQAPEAAGGFESSVRDRIVARELERGEEEMKTRHIPQLIPVGVVAAVAVIAVVLVNQISPVKTVERQAVPKPIAVASKEKVGQIGPYIYPEQPSTQIYYEGITVAKNAIRSTAESAKADGMADMYDYAAKSLVAGVQYPPQSEFFEEEYRRIYDNNFQTAQDNPLSTFSIDVDTAAYSNVRRFLANNQMPPADAVRIEEMINYFTYDYPQPAGADPFSITTEYAACPWNAQHKLVLIGLQGKKIETKDLPPSNLVFLIDVSGSMQDYNKLPLLKSAFGLLVDQLRAEDKISIVVYAGSSGVVLDSVPGSEKAKIKQAIDNLRAGGSTAGAQGIVAAYDIAKKNLLKDGNNRIILATDGDFNVGITSESELLRMIEERRNEGVFLTILGFGMGNYKDSKMEQMADKGNGSIAYIDSLLEAKKVFVQQLTGTLFTIAKDVKVQVEFNPSKVKAYRLVGYENRRLENRDFNDDKKDAGELGAGHTVTALYEIVAAGSQEDMGSTDPLKYQHTAVTPSSELLTVKLRYKAPASDTSTLLSRVIKAGEETIKPSENFRFATSVAEFGLLLRRSEHKANASYQQALERARQSKGADADGYRADFIRLVEIAQILDK